MVIPIPRDITTALRTPRRYAPIEMANKKTTTVPGQGTIPAPSISIKSVDFALV